jgi:tetratricopeptide (TPR) repeat protein
MRDDDEEIREIKREIIESRGLIIKTSNLVNSLSADIKAIAKRQASYERRFNMNSAVVYVLVAGLSFAGLKLASDARISEVESQKAALETQLEELRNDVAEESRRAEDRARAEIEAARYYDLIRAGKREQVVEGYEAVTKLELSRAERASFRDTYDRFRLDIAVAAFHAGLAASRAGRYHDAVGKFEESLALKDDAPHVPELKFHMADALRKMGRHSEAMVQARKVIEQNEDRELHDDAYWLLALAAEEAGDFEAAREALRTLNRRFPRSPFIRDVRQKLRDLRLR